MGVVGLSSFMAQNPDVFIRQDLHDITILIDGNNLFYFLYYENQLPCKYGGNYDEYAKVVADFFTVLQRCNIKPFVIFDGSYYKDNRKLPTILKRARDRIHVCTHKYEKGQGQILPILAKSVFMQTLDAMGVSHITCDFEADECIAALAIHWNCPVVSKDSDFYIYDLPKGYIPITSLNTNVKTDENGANCLSVYIYFRETFAKRFQFDPTMIPLLATLLGNDVVGAVQFQSFYAHLSQARKKTSKQKQQRIPNKNVISVVEWLRYQTSLESAYDRIVLHQKKELRDKTLKIITKSMNSYSELTSTLHLYLSDSKLLNPDLTDYFGSRFPDEYVGLFRTGKLASFIMNSAVVHRVMLLCQMEDFSQSSSYVCSSEIRQIIYSVLLNSKPFKRGLSKRRDLSIEEYDRSGKKLIKRVCTISNTKIELSLLDVLDLDDNRRKDFILKILTNDSSCFGQFPDDMLLYFIVIVYWVKNAATKLNRNHVRAVVISWIKIAGIDMFQKKTDKLFASSKVSQSIQSQLVNDKSDNLKDISNACERLKKFDVQHRHSSKDPFEIDVVHGFAQLQSIILAVMHLNQLFLQPFEILNPALLLNATFAYNICRELMSRKNPDLYVSEILGRQTAITELYEKIMAAITESVGLSDEYFVEQVQRKKPKKIGSYNSTKKVDKNVSAQYTDSDDEAKILKKADSLSQDVTNRFALLGLADSDSSDGN